MGGAVRVSPRDRNPYAQSRELLDAVVDALLQASGSAGVLRTDVFADDVLINLSGIALAAGELSQRDKAGRLLELLMDGLRHRP